MVHTRVCMSHRAKVHVGGLDGEDAAIICRDHRAVVVNHVVGVVLGNPGQAPVTNISSARPLKEVVPPRTVGVKDLADSVVASNWSVIVRSRLVRVEDPLRVVVGVEKAVSAQHPNATVWPAVGSEATTVAVCKEKRGRVTHVRAAPISHGGVVIVEHVVEGDGLCGISGGRLVWSSCGVKTAISGKSDSISTV